MDAIEVMSGRCVAVRDGVGQSMMPNLFQKPSAQRRGNVDVSSDVKKLMKEAKAAGETARAQRLATLKAKEKPRYCPPQGSQRMGSDEFMERLGALPRAERIRINMTEAMIRILAVKFPC